jgi:hypothetical protein
MKSKKNLNKTKNKKKTLSNVNKKKRNVRNNKKRMSKRKRKKKSNRIRKKSNRRKTKKKIIIKGGSSGSSEGGVEVPIKRTNSMSSISSTYARVGTPGNTIFYVNTKEIIDKSMTTVYENMIKDFIHDYISTRDSTYTIKTEKSPIEDSSCTVVIDCHGNQNGNFFALDDNDYISAYSRTGVGLDELSCWSLAGWMKKNEPDNYINLPQFIPALYNYDSRLYNNDSRLYNNDSILDHALHTYRGDKDIFQDIELLFHTFHIDPKPEFKSEYHHFKQVFGFFELSEFGNIYEDPGNKIKILSDHLKLNQYKENLTHPIGKLADFFYEEALESLRHSIMIKSMCLSALMEQFRAALIKKETKIRYLLLCCRYQKHNTLPVSRMGSIKKGEKGNFEIIKELQKNTYEIEPGELGIYKPKDINVMNTFKFLKDISKQLCFDKAKTEAPPIPIRKPDLEKIVYYIKNNEEIYEGRTPCSPDTLIVSDDPLSENKIIDKIILINKYLKDNPKLKITDPIIKDIISIIKNINKHYKEIFSDYLIFFRIKDYYISWKSMLDYARENLEEHEFKLKFYKIRDYVYENLSQLEKNLYDEIIQEEIIQINYSPEDLDSLEDLYSPKYLYDMIIQSYYKSSGADLNLQILMHNIKTDIENINKYLDDHSLDEHSLDSYFLHFPKGKKKDIKKWINELRQKIPKINMDYIKLLKINTETDA